MVLIAGLWPSEMSIWKKPGLWATFFLKQTFMNIDLCCIFYELDLFNNSS